MASKHASPTVPSSTPGLDSVLHGGYLPGHTAILTGGPGSGRTILGLQFLAAAEGPALYVGFEERESELRRHAESLGIDLSDVTVRDLSAEGTRFFSEDSYTLFSSDAVEGEELIAEITPAFGEIQKAIEVLKKRFGDFERSLRRRSINADGLQIGEPLDDYHGLLSGTPERDIHE
ncbi:MAG: ATPase domain-containing protein [Halobacteriales archaeon]